MRFSFLSADLGGIASFLSQVVPVFPVEPWFKPSGSRTTIRVPRWAFAALLREVTGGDEPVVPRADDDIDGSHHPRLIEEAALGGVTAADWQPMSTGARRPREMARPKCRRVVDAGADRDVAAVVR